MEESLPALIEGLRERGYKFLTLDSLLGISGSLDAETLKARSAHGPDRWSRFKSLLHTFLHEHSSPLELSLALGLGIVVGCSPFFGLHAFIGLVLAVRFRLNKLAVFLGTNISNPLTAPFVILSSIQIGWRILNGSWLTLSIDEMRSEPLLHLGSRFFSSWLVGFPLVGTALALLVMLVLYPLLLFRRSRVVEKTPP